MSGEKLYTLFEDSDLSALPAADPGSGKPWIDPVSHAIIVGALGTFGLTQAAADARYLQLSGGTLTGQLTVSGNITAGTTGAIAFSNRSRIKSTSDGNVSIRNWADSANADLIANSISSGTTTNDARMHFSGTSVQFWNGNITGYTGIQAGGATFNGAVNVTSNLSVSPTSGNLYVGNGTGQYFSWTNQASVSFVSNGTGLVGFHGGALNVNLGPNSLGFGSSIGYNVTDILAIRNSVGQLDIRADNGLRIRNYANSGDGAISASTGAFSGNVISTNAYATLFYPLAYAGAPATVNIGATGGSSTVMVVSGGGTQQLAIADTKLTIPSNWTLDFTSGNYNQSVDVRMLRSAAGQLDVRADNGLRLRNLASTADAPLSSGRMLVRSVNSLPDLSVWAPNYIGAFCADDLSRQELTFAFASNVSNIRPVFLARRSRGGLSSPAAVLDGDQIFSFLASAHDGTTFQNSALIDFIVDGTVSSGSVPMKISFVTGANLGSRQERLAVRATGAVEVKSTLTLGSFTVATLPSASANSRAAAFVTDSSLAYSSANLGLTVTAGGSNLVPVWSNGTNWVIG